jgi:hypothetical protein
MRVLPRLLVGLAVLTVGGASVVAFRDAPRFERDGALYSLASGGWRYSYHGVYGRETLVRVTAPGVDCAALEPETAARLRLLLLDHADAPDVETLKSRHAEEAAQLRFLGYL